MADQPPGFVPNPMPVALGGTPPVSQIDEYRIQGPLGRGGMGEVYLGYDTLLDRPVAVKFLSTRSPNERLRKRFLIEARAIAKLQHPNVVAVYRVGISNGIPYLVSELVAGQSLDRLPKPIPWEQALRIGIDLARGLTEVHRQGVLHRDLKPANAMLTPEGTAKLLDFGLAKLANELSEIPLQFVGREPREEETPTDLVAQAKELRRAALACDGSLTGTAAGDDETSGEAAVRSQHATEGSGELAEQDTGPAVVPLAQRTTEKGGRALRKQADSMLTDSGMLIGTPAYMPPEMWLGAPATEQSDLYMLGEVLYELCCGQPPHAYRRRNELRRAALHSDAVPLKQAAPDVNPRFASLIDACVRRDPDERPRSAAEVLKTLENIAKDPTDEVTRRRLRRRELLSRLVPLGLAAVFALSTVGVLYRDLHARDAQTATMAAPRPRVAVLGIQPDGMVLGQASFARTFSELLAGELSAGEKLLVLQPERVERAKLELKLDGSKSYPTEVLEKLYRSLGPDLIAVGSLSAAPGGKKQLIVQVSLRNSRSGVQVAAARVQGATEDLFTMVSQVGSELRKQLGLAALSMGDRTHLQAERPASLEVAKLYAEARTHLRRFDVVGARQLLQQVVGAEPDYPLGHLALSDALLALGYEDQAREEVGRAYKLSDRLPRASRSRIEARYRETTGEWPKAFALYRALRTSFPDDPEYGLELISAQLRGSQPAEALKTVSELRRVPARVDIDARVDLLEAKSQMELSNFADAVGTIERAIGRAESVGSPLLLADALLLDSFARTNLNEHARSLRSAERARELFASAGNLYGEVDSMLAASNAASALGDYERAGELNEATLQLVMELGNTSLTAVHLGNMADLLVVRGQLGLAVARAQAGLLLARQVTSREATLQALVILGEIALLRGNLQSAEERLLQAQRELPQPDEPRMSAWVAWHLGELRLSQGRFDEAERQHQASLEGREKNQLDGFVPESQVALSALALLRGQLPEGERLARAALARFVEAKNTDSAAWAQALLAQALARQGRLVDGQAAFRAALERLSSTQNLLVRVRGLSALAGGVAELRLPNEDMMRLREQLRDAVTQARAGELLSGELELSIYLHRVNQLVGLEEPGRHDICFIGQRAQASGLVRLAGLSASFCSDAEPRRR